MTPLAFVDLETTGATASIDRITEIGIIEVDADGSVREWQQLINPGVRIPPFIEQLTGISNAMVGTAPRFEAIAAEVLKRLQGRLFIAHNARFDYGFLKNEFKRLDISFRAAVLCTVKLSRALWPEHKKHSLDALIARHDLHADARHRALADAQLIHQFWQKIHVDRQHQDIQAAVQAQNAHPSLPPQLDPAIIDELPDSPGVYLFYGENNLPLYIGKSKDIRQRVLSHFAADHSSSKEMALSQQIKRLDWQETAGEIGALLLEAKLVKQWQPSHNRLLRKNEALCSFTLVDEGQGWMRPQIVVAEEIDFSQSVSAYGLFKNRVEANKVLRNLIQDHKLCDTLCGLEKVISGKPCFGFQLKRCHGGCVGHEPLAKHSMRLLGALMRLKLLNWPFAGPGIIREQDEAHVIDGWRYLGTAKNTTDLSELRALTDKSRAAFDRDTYKILTKNIGKIRRLNDG